MCFVVQHMDIIEEYRTKIDLPVEVLKKASKLRNSLRGIWIALYINGKSTSSELAELVGLARAYVNMRLQQLVDMNYATVEQKERTKYFEALV